MGTDANINRPFIFLKRKRQMLHAFYAIPLALSLVFGGASAALAADPGMNGGCTMPSLAAAHAASGGTTKSAPGTKATKKTSKKGKGVKKSRKSPKHTTKPVKPASKKSTKKSHKAVKKAKPPIGPAMPNSEQPNGGSGR
jgi:hypothetical protein